jgi:hypothetical protein
MKKLLMVLFAIFLVSGFAGAYILGNPNPDNNNNNQNNNKYGTPIEISGYAFYQLADGTFVTEYETGGGKIPIQFRLDPRAASNMTLDDTSVSAILNSNKIYMTSSPNQPDLGKFAVASAEISRILSLYGLETIAAFTEDSDPPSPSVPLRTCDDASLSTKTAVIYLALGNTTGIANYGNCITVTGKTADDLILAADKLGYNLIGIKL